LLGHLLLTKTDDEVAADIWRVRERTEHEAAALFARLASDMSEAGVPDTLVTLAKRSSDDERTHAGHCRRIVDELSVGHDPLEPDLDIVLGNERTPLRRALYTSVALGCITETLSTALLIEMRPHARLGVLRDGLDAILADEVRHSRLGWAHLAFEAERGEVSWLDASVPAMVRDALAADVPPDAGPGVRDLRALGILARADVKRIFELTFETTIVPGLARFGVRSSA